jgi:hypothetical protein
MNIISGSMVCDGFVPRLNSDEKNDQSTSMAPKIWHNMERRSTNHTIVFPENHQRK